MKKATFFIFGLIALASCKKNEVMVPLSFEEKTVNFAIQQKNGRPIEIKDLYESLTHTIPADDDEQLVLAEILKKKGFEVINWGRGNFLHGPRMVVLTLQKDDCRCDVTKYYYTESDDSTYLRTESISCW